MPDGDAILIVDDEQLVLDVACAMVRQIGYRPLCALTGEEALKTLADRGQELCCIILDLAMPGMDGRQCLKEIRRLDPDLKVLLSSGYREEQAAAMFLPDEGPDGFIKKPFMVASLADTIEALLA